MDLLPLAGILMIPTKAENTEGLSLSAKESVHLGLHRQFLHLPIEFAVLFETCRLSLILYNLWQLLTWCLNR